MAGAVFGGDGHGGKGEYSAGGRSRISVKEYKGGLGV